MSTSSTQAAGYCYDSAGNLLLQATCPTGSFTPTYFYNAENQLTSTAGVNYSYDGDGKRVMKSSGTIYWYGMNGSPLDETDSSGNTNNSSFFEYFFFGGQRIARRDYQNNVDYYFDHLGTSRVVTNSSGTILDDSDFYPFGAERPVLSSSGNHYKFTGKERDSESGLDYFGARFNASNFGRFMSPDQKQLTARHLGSPQKWNKYAYVQNNPLLRVDPNGLDDYVVFRTATLTGPHGEKTEILAGTREKEWADVKKAVESTKDAKGRQNTFHMFEGEKATVENYKTATATLDTHVVFVGHAAENPGTGATQGIQLSDGYSYGKNGSDTFNASPGPNGEVGHQEYTMNEQISASSVALFACDSYNLTSQYDDTYFTGVQSGPDGTSLDTLDLGAAAWLTALGGQAGDAAANAVIDQSPFVIDDGDNVQSEPPKKPD